MTISVNVSRCWPSSYNNSTKAPDFPEIRSRMGELQKQTLEIAADIQSLSHELHSAKLQYLGIAAAMRGFCQEFGEQQKGGD